MSEPDFENRVVLVTGGSRGIGRACCERLAQAGAKIAINFRSRESDAEETAALVEAAGSKAVLAQADVTDWRLACKADPLWGIDWRGKWTHLGLV